jgi:uncharacterized protein YjiS (DUF1127 family)
VSKHEVEFFDPNDRGLSGQAQLGRSIVEQAKTLRAAFLHELWRQIRSWHRRRTGLAQLRALDDAALKDIGLHRSGIEAAVSGREAVTAPPQKKQVSPGCAHLLLQRMG